MAQPAWVVTSREAGRRMIVLGEPRLEEEKDAIRLGSQVQIRHPRLDLREECWYRFPKSYERFVAPHMDAFVVAFLPTAMTLGAPLTLQSPVSRRLAYGLREYQRIQSIWWPDKFTEIEIRYAGFEDRAVRPTRAAVGTTFSGGLDSFYTLWRHLPVHETLPGLALTHCLLINGFDKDVYLGQPERFARLYDTYRPMLDRLGIELLSVQTNAMRFRKAAIPGSDLRQSFGVSLAAAGLTLAGLFGRFYIPGSLSYRPEHMVPEGAHPMLDHLHSTESLEVTHDGCDASRVQKTTAVADWDECQQRLRVCFRRETYDEQTGQLYNCCRCEKCVRTMTTLDALGKLTAFASFPRPLSRDGIRRTSHEKPGSRLFFDDILSLARASGRRDLIFDLRYARLRSLMASAVPPRLRAWLRHIRNWRSDAAPPMYR